MGLLRIAEILFALYCFIHIPIGILFDTQQVSSFLQIPDHWYPELVKNLSRQYVVDFKDPYFVTPPSWYRIYTFFEICVHLPFCLVAGIAFLRGNCAWMRIPTIVYSTHVATTLLPILYSFAIDDFSKMNRVGPVTQEERLSLMSVYAPWLFIPLLMLFTMLVNGDYGCANQQPQQKTEKAKKKQFSKKNR